jgi:hypothetical protein
MFGPMVRPQRMRECRHGMIKAAGLAWVRIAGAGSHSGKDALRYCMSNITSSHTNHADCGT